MAGLGYEEAWVDVSFAVAGVEGVVHAKNEGFFVCRRGKGERANLLAFLVVV